MKKRDSFNVSYDNLSFYFHNRTENRQNRESKGNDNWHHYDLFRRVANLICEQRGFEASDTPYSELVTVGYPSLWSDYRWGGNKHLRFEGHKYPSGFEFKFWYQGSREGRSDNNGHFDSNKEKNATTVERLTFKNIAWKISSMLSLLGYEDRGLEYRLVGREKVMWKINEDPDRHWGKWEEYKDEPYHKNYNGIDRDKKTIENGQVKYFRGFSSRLLRGEVYHNINNMWWVVLSHDKYTNVANFELFDAGPDDFAKRRLARDLATQDERVRRKIGTKRYNELKALGIDMKLVEEVKS